MKKVKIDAFHKVQVQFGIFSILHLTAVEARELAERLIKAAEDVESGKGADNAWYATNRSGMWRDA